MQFKDVRRNRVRKLWPGRGGNILYIVLLTPAGMPRTQPHSPAQCIHINYFYTQDYSSAPKMETAGSSKNADNDLPHNTVSHPRRQYFQKIVYSSYHKKYHFQVYFHLDVCENLIPVSIANSCTKCNIEMYRNVLRK